MAVTIPEPYTEAPALTSRQIDDFWSRMIRLDGGCWHWSGHVGSSGYGTITYGRRYSGSAHRLAYLLAHGPIAPGLYVMHSCDQRTCCNPDHLSLGTPRDNLRDAIRKGRMPRGSKHPAATVTEEQVIAMRDAYRSSLVTMEQLADQYGLTTSAVRLIIRGVNWRHLPGAYVGRGHWSHLTEEQVTEMRRRFAANPNLKLDSLAREYGVAPTVVRNIIRGKLWKHAPGPILPPGVDLRRSRRHRIWDEADDVHRAHRAGTSMRALAARYGVSVTTVHKLLHTTPPPE